jgi:hypothetical protein
VELEPRLLGLDPDQLQVMPLPLVPTLLLLRSAKTELSFAMSPRYTLISAPEASAGLPSAVVGSAAGSLDLEPMEPKK